ncbi:MAG: CvpA family protein [Planctomycetaceae bacterium]
MEPMWFDGIILLILIVATLRGAVKGFVWQLAWIAAIVASFAFSEFASVTVANAIPVEAPMNRWLAMLGLYVAAAFVSFAVAIRLRDWIEKIKFKDFDRHLGMIFGFIKGAALSMVLVFFSVTLSAAIRETAMDSRSGYAAAVLMQNLHPMMPEELHDVLHPYVHELDEVNGVDMHSNGNRQHSHRGKTGRGGSGATEKPGALTKRPSAGTPKNWPDSLSLQEDERRELMFRIAAVYARLPDDRLAIVEEMQVRLGGIADGVVLGFLRDWDADMRPGAIDPDPATNAQTQFRDRVRHHVESAGNRTTSRPGNSTR